MDHLILYADYKTPDMHSHLAAHLLLAEQGKVYCRIGEEKVTGYAPEILQEAGCTTEPMPYRMQDVYGESESGGRPRRI